MRGFKGFNRDLTCTMGNGTFQYKVGETYKEEKADTAKTGFHFVEEPLEVLSWYPNGRYCLIEATGDIDEDENKLSCTEIKIIKELSLMELYAWEVRFITENPRRQIKRAEEEKGEAQKGKPVLVIGKNPKAKGHRGSSLFVVKKNHNRVIEAAGFLVDGKDFKANTYYDVKGVAVDE